MRLIGPKEFLKTVKPGTLYRRFWQDNYAECCDVIRCYKTDTSLINTNYYSEFEMFGDNSGSLAFVQADDVEPVIINGHKYYGLFYYDANVVGDAGPTTTLYLVYDSEDEWPAEIKTEDSGGNELEGYYGKEQLREIRNWLINTNHFKDETKGWALEKLETDEHYKDDPIVNYRGE